jgi:predicted MFS family arabinose efflux permease
MALFTSSLQFGFVTGALLGGQIVDDWGGYTYLGPVAGIIALVSVVVFWLYVKEPEAPEPESESPPEAEVTPVSVPVKETG